jgi:hypothetical protein
VVIYAGEWELAECELRRSRRAAGQYRNTPVKLTRGGRPIIGDSAEQQLCELTLGDMHVRHEIIPWQKSPPHARPSAHPGLALQEHEQEHEERPRAVYPKEPLRSVCLCISVYLSVCLSISLSLCVCVCVRLSLCVFVCLRAPAETETQRERD